MIVCSCKVIREAQLRRLPSRPDGRPIRLADAVRELGLGTGCGRCLPHAHRLLREAEDAPAAVSGHGGWLAAGALPAA